MNNCGRDTLTRLIDEKRISILRIFKPNLDLIQTNTIKRECVAYSLTANR